jgi:hypothetical protein
LEPSTRAAITAALINTESTANQYGWNRAPVLFGLFDLPCHDEHGTLQVDPTLVEPGVWDVADPANPGEDLPIPHVLHHFARDLASAAMRDWLQEWLHRGARTCIGAGLVFEAWTGPARPGYRRGDLAKSPSHGEIRVVVAVDTDLGVHQVTRVRGAQISTERPWRQPSARSHDGTIVTGLRAVTELARTR